MKGHESVVARRTRWVKREGIDEAERVGKGKAHHGIRGDRIAQKSLEWVEVGAHQVG